MSAILRCFSRPRRGSLDKESMGSKKKKKCRCKCHKYCNTQDDTPDGKSFSKTLHVSSRKCKKHSASCCETNSDGNRSSGSDHYVSLPSPSASVDPSGTPFFMTHMDSLPGRGYMPVSKDDPNYNMNHPRRGRAVIFNFDRWDNTNIPTLGLSPRLGSEKDKKDLARCLKRLDFDVKEHDNVKHLEMWAFLENIRKEDHSDADCLIVVVMTHGEKNTIYMRDGTQIPINLIWENFEAHKCPSLAGKPKIFIVQACRGKQYDSGTTMVQRTAADSEELFNRSDVTDATTFSYVIPNAADILVAFSCPLGHYSWRHPERGSWFIQAICKVFNRHAYDMNVQELFTNVAREVALNYQSTTDSIESNGKKQVTSTSSTLIRNVMFRPKNLNPSPHTRPLPLDQEIATLEDSRVALTSVTQTNFSAVGAAVQFHSEESQPRSHVSFEEGEEEENPVFEDETVVGRTEISGPPIHV